MNLETKLKSTLVQFFREGTNGDYLDALNDAIYKIAIVFSNNMRQADINQDTAIVVTEAQLNKAIKALTNTSRVINNLNQDCLADDNGGLVFINDNTNNKNVRDLWDEVKDVRMLLSQIIQYQTVSK